MIVWIWTLTAVLGTALAIWGTLDALGDLEALGKIQNGRRMLAVGWVRREAFRIFIQGVWAIIGVAALLMGMADGEASLCAYLLEATSIAVLLNTLLDIRDRYALKRIID